MSESQLSAAPAAADRRIAFWLGALVTLVGSLIVYDAHDGNTDAEVHFQQIRAMAQHGSWAFVDDNPNVNLIIRAESAAGPASASEKGVDGRVYGHFGIYYVLLGVQFYAAGEAISQLCPGVEARVAGSPFLIARVGAMQDYIPRIAVAMISPLFLGLAAASIYAAARRLRAGRAAALLIALAYPYATFAGVIARHCGSDTMAAGLLAFALERALAARWEGRRAFVAVGIAAGLLTGSRYLAIAVLPGVAAVALLSALRRHQDWPARLRDLAPAVIPWAALTAVVLVVNALRWGGPFEWGYRHSFRDDQVLRGNLLEAAARNLYLSFFAGSRGLVFFAFPIVVLGAVGLLRLWRSDRAVAASLLLGIASTAVPPALSILWSGTWSWGPRYHLSCLVFFAPAAAAALDAALARGGAWRAAGLGALAAGALTTFPALVSSPFGLLQAESESLRIVMPTPRSANPNDPIAEGEAEASRQEFIPVAPFWSPYNAIRGQWRWLWWGLRGEEAIPVRAFFGADSDAVMTPQLIEWGGLRSPWWLAFRARTGDSWVLAVAAALGFLALKSGLELRKAWRATRAEP